MKNLFLVSVAIGIFSGTTLLVKAQPAVNLEKISHTRKSKKSLKFIDGIEIKSRTSTLEDQPPFNNAKTASTLADNEAVSGIESFTGLQFKYAQLLNIDVELITNKTLFTEIEKWWGTRYRYGGATEQGIDCSAYTSTLIHQVYDLVIARTSRDQYDECIKLDKEDIQQGDLVFFKTRRGVSHVGLYLGNGYFTHASTSIGATISNLSETYWSHKYIGCGRINIAAVLQ